MSELKKDTRTEEQFLKDLKDYINAGWNVHDVKTIINQRIKSLNL